MFNFFGHLKWKMSCPQERASICESKSLSSVKFGLFISKLWQNSKPIYHFSGGHISKSFGSIAFFTLTASFWDKLVSYPPWKKKSKGGGGVFNVYIFFGHFKWKIDKPTR